MFGEKERNVTTILFIFDKSKKKTEARADFLIASRLTETISVALARDALIV